MSYCSIISFKNGVPDEELECKNSWGGAAYIWTTLFDRYIKDPTIPYDNWGIGPNKNWFHDILRHSRIQECAKAVHLATGDRAIIDNENFKRFAADLREFIKIYGTGPGVCHLEEWAKFVDDHGDAEAIGFYHTSCGQNLWWVQSERTCGECGQTIEDKEVHYNLNTGVEHFEVYAELADVNAKLASGEIAVLK